MVLVQKELKNAYIGEYRVPWANTIAYYPLTSTTTTSDMSWNNKNLTNYNNVSFWTYQWVSCASFNGSSQYLGLWAKFTLWNTYTVLSWYWHTASNVGMVYCQWASSSLYPAFWAWRAYGSWTKIVMHSGSWWNNTWIVSDNSSNNWKWVLWVFVFNNGTARIYENNTQTVSGSLSAPWTWWEDFYIWMRRQWYNYFSGLISNLIIENKSRTAQEISDYYNLTKSKYWL